MKKGFILSLVLLLGLGVLASCGENNNSSSQDSASYEDGHYVNSLKLTRSFEGKKFTEDGIGEVLLASCTDGDTAKFYNVGETTQDRYALRFLGVNTPESTAKVEPWGKSASVYTQNVLNSATSIVLENDISVWGQMDNNGYRYLGFIWYKTAGDTEYKNLNLELVEKGYSRNQLFDDSSLCPYRTTFEAADNAARSKGLRVHGEIDPNYDYSNEIIELTIAECRKNYNEYGMGGETGASSGKRLRIEAVVVGMIGDNMVLRDLVPDEDTGLYAGIYAYLGYNTALDTAVDPGDIVKFYCRLSKFNDSMQLTDVKSSFLDKNYPFQIVKTAEEVSLEEYPSYNIDPVVVDPNTITSPAGLGKYSGGYIRTEVTIREVDLSYDGTDNDNEEGEVLGYYKKDKNNNMTVYAQLNRSSFVKFNLRIDGLSNPYPSHTLFEVGKTYRVEGYVAPYYEAYQLQLFNNISSEYIVPLN